MACAVGLMHPHPSPSPLSIALTHCTSSLFPSPLRGPKGCVAVFRGYLDSLRHAWVGYDRDDKGRGIALALDVIISLQGPNADGSKGVQQGQGKRRPLSHPMLHRSVVVMSRVLDLWKAPLSIGHDDFVSGGACAGVSARLVTCGAIFVLSEGCFVVTCVDRLHRWADRWQ